MILLQVGLFAFGICAIAALMVDFGYVTLTRVQMQNAVDAAALEGLRYDDDLTGRQRAADMAALLFENPDPRYAYVPFGAGPAAEVDPSSRLLSYDPNNLAYKPALKRNTANEQDGDMVRGQYVRGGPAVEAADYSRGDFIPGGSPQDAFLVRMRRTNREVYAADDPSRSAGPAIPFLFGRGALIADTDGPSLRNDGIVARGTAIAESRLIRPNRVGVAYATPTLSGWGAASFALTESISQTIGSLTVEISPTGTITLSSGGTPIGRTIEARCARFVSASVVDPSCSALVTPVNLIGYVPIYGESGLTENRVIGFVEGSISSIAPGPATIVLGPGLLDGTKLSNATRRLYPLPEDPTRTPEILAAVLVAHNAFPANATVRTPVLVR